MGTAAHVTLLVFACSGCDTVFGLERGTPPLDADVPLPSCTQPPADALRYTFARTTTRFDLATARQRCAEQGGDLAVINDEAERMFVNTTFGTLVSEAPILVGVTDEVTEGTFVGVDGCAPALYWGFAEPNGNRGENCVAIGDFGFLHDGSCDGQFGGAIVRTAACETPRWPTEGCLRAVTEPRQLVMRGALTYAKAVETCRELRGHLIEIDSSAELATAHQRAGNAPFWIGARSDGARWSSATGCPQLFPWLAGEPTLANGECAMIDAIGAKVAPCTDMAEAMCEVP